MPTFQPLTDPRRRVLLILGVSRACSDAAGTTPCNDGDHCNYLQDLSGNGYHALTNGTNPAPVYRANGLGGRPYLDFSAGASLAITPDASLNGIQATHDYTVYGFGTTGPGSTVPGNGTAKFVSQSADTDFTGVLDLQFSNNFLATGGYGATAQVSCFPNGTGTRPYYVPANTYVRWGWTENASDRYRMLFNGLPCGGNGSAPGETPNTTGNVIIGAKYFTAWNDWRSWYGQWHGLCVYANSLQPAEVWQLDQYLIGLRSQVHPVASLPWMLIWDGNSMAGINTYLVPDVVKVLGLDPTTVPNFAWHFKTTSQMIQYGGEIDNLIAVLPPSPRKVLCFHELTNDFGTNPASTLFQHYQAYGSARLAGGANALVAATMLDQQSMSSADEARRAALNALVRTPTTPFWQVADWATSPGLEPWNATNYSDNLHPNVAGDALGAPYFAAAITAASVPPPPPPPPSGTVAAAKRWTPGLARGRARSR
jgi:hypothetical protein